MFWIGIIIGMVITIVGGLAICTYLIKKWSNMSMDEYVECIDAVFTAGNNREAILQVWHDGELIDGVILEEK